MPSSSPILLTVVADGLGYPLQDPATDMHVNSAVRPDTCPNIFRLIQQGSTTLLEASCEPVGLAAGQMGGSEGGHATIGSGQPVALGAGAIVDAFKSGAFEKSAPMQDAINHLKTMGKTMHLLGILSDGGVHSNLDDIIRTAKIFADKGIKVHVHGLADGRDVFPHSVKTYLQQFYEATHDNDNIELVSLCGRAKLDRAENWEVTNKLIQNICTAHTKTWHDGIEAAEDFYSQSSEPDEHMGFYALKGHSGIQDGDCVLICHHRPDRVQQPAAVFDGNYSGFTEKPYVPFIPPKIHSIAAFIPLGKVSVPYITDISYPLQTVTSLYTDAGHKVLKVAEKQKGPHATVFYNGGNIKKHEGETQIIIASDKDNFDQNPAMKAPEITERVIEGLQSGDYSHIFVNYANPDMVGHTGNLAATEQAVKIVDEQLERILKVIRQMQQEVVLVFTADHGNAEKMAVDGKMQTSHSVGAVPCVFYNRKIHGNFDFNTTPVYIAAEQLRTAQTRSIANIAATSLKIMQEFGLNLPIPDTMEPALDVITEQFSRLAA